MNRGHPGIPLAREEMTPQEIEEAEAHLVECEECAARIRGLMSGFLEADVAATSIAPSPALRQRLLSSITSARPRLFMDGRQLGALAAYAVRRRGYAQGQRRSQHRRCFLGVHPSPCGSFPSRARPPGAGERSGPAGARTKSRRAGLWSGRSRHELFAMPIIDCTFLAILHIGVRFGELEFLANVLS